MADTMREKLLFDHLAGRHDTDINREPTIKPSELNLHGLTFDNAASYRRTDAGHEAYIKFGNFIRELVPEASSEQATGRIARHLLRIHAGTRPYSPLLFDMTEADKIIFEGTDEAGLSYDALVETAGGGKIGRSVLRLFDVLGDQERTAAAYLDNKYELQETTYSDSARYLGIEGQRARHRSMI